MAFLFDAPKAAPLAAHSQRWQRMAIRIYALDSEDWHALSSALELALRPACT